MQTSPVALPQPDALSAAHAEQVLRYIREQSGGSPISFAEFMHHALYAPGLGYYAAGATKLGADGDFVTAPEVSPLFGRVMARQLAETLQHIDDADVLEVGAGTGALAVDLLLGLKAAGALPRRYRILEVSADLTQRQRQTIEARVPELLPIVEWESQWPEQIRGAVVANEVLDALPFERFQRRASGVYQQCVSFTDDGAEWSSRPAPDRLAALVNGVEDELERPLAEGYTSEISPAAARWVADLAGRIDEAVVLLFDYGISRREYYAQDRSDGWMRCHFRHHAHNNPLTLFGIQDITTWVDFSMIAGTAADAGLDILGYTPQAQFLLGGGLESAVAELAGESLAEQVQLSGQIKTLTLPGEMGEHFKCLALGRGAVPVPSAFNLADRTHTL